MREREIHTEREKEGETDREDEEALLPISSYTTSRVKGTNTFVLAALKVQTLTAQEAALQRQQRDKEAGLCAHIGFNQGSLLCQI